MFCSGPLECLFAHVAGFRERTQFTSVGEFVLFFVHLRRRYCVDWCRLRGLVFCCWVCFSSDVCGAFRSQCRLRTRASCVLLHQQAHLSLVLGWVCVQQVRCFDVQRVCRIWVGQQLGQETFEDVHQLVHRRPGLVDHV